MKYPLLISASHYEDILRSGSIAPCILNLSTRRRWAVTFVHRQPYLRGERPHYPLDRRLGGPQI